MSIAVFLSALLILGGLEGVTASDLQFYGKSVPRDKTLLGSEDGRHTVRRQTQQQTKSIPRRSLDLESFKFDPTPTSKISLPIMIRLYPPTVQPLTKYIKMPPRFGRQSNNDDDTTPNSTPNMPQRFGRAWELIQMCPGCPRVRGAVNAALPQRFGRNILSWRLLRTLVSDHTLKKDVHWTEDFDLTENSEEMETEHIKG
ncbi:pro-FMRFamide-related neuropeptide VF [Cheilinus undulatus]|uniref:pro-FMRFamide-related neuropeptide VF n=1 Tax=Cheilinus undulatus TaxID=241271 RepID=UPI001BD5C2C4|nr:pro-FMRFamide-related neuropeptide VF [Cheilinus undulatus]